MKRISPTLMIFLLLFPLTAIAGPAGEIPSLLKTGFDKYATDGPRAAIESWSKGSTLDGSKEVLSQANKFKQIEDFYGKYVGYELVRNSQISESTSACLVNIKYEKGNLFSAFYLYRKPDGQQVVTTFNFHTVATEIWPESVIFGCDR